MAITNPEAIQFCDVNADFVVEITFQDGSIDDGSKADGLTDEALLAIVADRLGGFQQGSMACRENALALAAVITAMLSLKSRSQKRLDRGV